MHMMRLCIAGTADEDILSDPLDSTWSMSRDDAVQPVVVAFFAVTHKGSLVPILVCLFQIVVRTS